MKALATTTSLWLLLMSLLSAGPGNIRLKIEWIEIPTENIINLTLSENNNGNKIRAKVQRLLLSKVAKMHDMSITTVAKKATIAEQYSIVNRSVTQMVYPTEYEPDKFSPDRFELELKEQEERGYWTIQRYPGAASSHLKNAL